MRYHAIPSANRRSATPLELTNNTLRVTETESFATDNVTSHLIVEDLSESLPHLQHLLAFTSLRVVLKFCYDFLFC